MSSSETEREAMRRAIELARRGPRGLNPQVGALILSPAGEVIAEGWHHGAGTPHAEVDALSHLAPGTAHGSTAVVTLEPCNHTGRTGPCTRALHEAGIARVVFAYPDPGEHSGGGARALREAGIEVESGLLRDEVGELISDWLHVQRTGRPRVTLKWAQTLDGRIAAADGTSQWITGPAARADVHRRRARADAIAAGTGTILADDAALTARGDDGVLLADQPRPVVVGAREIPADAAVRAHPRPLLHVREHDPALVLQRLRNEGVQSLFVEGGPTLASAFVRAGLFDELVVYLAPALLGGSRLAVGDIGIDTITDATRLHIIENTVLGEDVLVVATPLPPTPEGVH